MSYGRFAAITSELLARKGEARAWPIAPPPERPRPDVLPPPPIVAPAMKAVSTAKAAPPVMPPPPPAVRKCSIRMSAHDFERLGIIAVKDDTTRQHLLQQALADLLAMKEKQYRPGCLCMAAAPCGACEAP
jgi:hypothetical protein